jgi:YgiT-type zinc finger domain-containing protein
MMCIVCKHGETRLGVTTVVLQRGAATVVINDVPARVCENCGEEYVDEQVVERVLAEAPGLNSRRCQGGDPRLHRRVMRPCRDASLGRSRARPGPGDEDLDHERGDTGEDEPTIHFRTSRSASISENRLS